MTKKGIILSVILMILLLTIVTMVSIRSVQIHKDLRENIDISNTDVTKPISEFDLDLTYITGFDLVRQKSYKLPIIIQFGSSEDELCIKMYPELKELNEETYGRAIVKYIDTKKYKELWNDNRVELGDEPMQLLFDSEGSPYKTTASEALGYKLIKDDKGNHIYTIHYGDFTLNEMREILQEMGMK